MGGEMRKGERRGMLMSRARWHLILIAGMLSGSVAVPGVAGAESQASSQARPVVAGGFLHGLVKTVTAGKVAGVPLPGVTITATNTLTGKRFATTTDITGAWSMTIPQNGRYVLRTEFTAFAVSTHEALLNASARDQKVDFELELASRAVQQDARETQQGQQISQVMRQLGATGAQSLSLISSLAAGTDAAEGGSGVSGAALPGAAGNANFGTDSVAVTGQAGTVSPLAGIDVDRIRDVIETARAQAGAGGGTGGGLGGFLGGSEMGGGGFGGFGGRGGFRNFRPDQPHGGAFWTGSNSALNALPFALRGQSPQQPGYGTNRFGLTFIGAPRVPGMAKPSGKQTIFLTLSGQRNSNPFNQYAVVPTQAERGDCPAALSASASPACNLLTFFPLPNLPATGTGARGAYNYFIASTGQSNQTQAGLRYLRSLGANAGSPFGAVGGGRQNRSLTQGLRQSVNANVNWSHAASDSLNIFPELGGKQASDNYVVQAGYSLGYRNFNNNLQLGWNRTASQAKNFFTNGRDIASEIGVFGPGVTQLNASKLNYGVPSVVLSGLTGLNEQQPSLRVQQTISLTETLAWNHGKHNYRFGGDLRRVHLDVLGSSNATGTFYFTGFATGSALGDLLGGLPQESTIQSSIAKSYLRQNVWDLFVQDDFRATSILSLNYGLRYEYFSPFSEKYGHLAELATNQGFTQVGEVISGCGGDFCGGLPATLVQPFRAAIAPRLGVALRLPKSTVVRAGYGINYTNGQYASFATTLSRQPPFANVQTNQATLAAPILLSHGFPLAEADQPPNYAIEPHYVLPYVQVWNIDVQKALPWGIVFNGGYNGSKGTHLDITSAPRPMSQVNQFGNGDVLFNYEQSSAFSNFNAATVRLRKRMQNGVSLGANYQYSHSIDNAGSIGGTSTVVAQNWQNLLAEEGNSGFDQRHRVTGDYLFELPFGKDKQFLSGGGVASKVLEGFSVSGNFTFATGTPLTPSYAAAVSDVARGTAGSLRPNRLPGVSATAGGGSLQRWFNPGAFAAPVAGGFGNASRNSIAGPGTISNGMSLSKTVDLGDTRNLELRATANNVFNTVQYAGVDTNLASPTAGAVTSAGVMRQFNFQARFRF